MKRKHFITALFLGGILSLSAQKLTPEDLYNVEKVTALTGASQAQQDELLEALRIRKDSIDTTERISYKVFDKAYHVQLQEVLTQEQQLKVYQAIVTDSLVQAKLEGLSLVKKIANFPKDYAKKIQDTLDGFAYDFAFIATRYQFQLEEKSRRKKVLRNEYNAYAKIQIGALNTSEKAWKKAKKSCKGLPKEAQQLFKDYHFYRALSEQDSQYQEAIQEMSQTTPFDTMLLDVANRISKSSVQKSQNYQKQNKEAQNKILEAYSAQIYQDLQVRSANLESLATKNTSVSLTALIKETVSNLPEEALVAEEAMTVDSLNVQKQLNVLSESYDFRQYPKVYIPVLDKKLEKFAYDLTLLDVQYPEHSNAKTSKKSQLKKEYTHYFKNNKKALLSVEKMLKKQVKVCKVLTEEERELYKTYHFYLELGNGGVTEDLAQAEKETKTAEFKMLLDVLAACQAERTIKNIAAVRKQDSITKKEVKKQYTQLIAEELYARAKALEMLSPSELEDFNPVATSQDVIETEESKREQREIAQQKEKEATEKERFYKKAEKAGLNEEKTVAVWTLLEEKKAALEAIKASRKAEKSSVGFDFSEASSNRTNGEIKKEFAEKLSKTLTQKEYAKLLGSNFKKKAEKDAGKELKGILEGYSLTEEQEKELSKKVLQYHLNKLVTGAYYSYNKKLNKQKQSVLRYRYEKDYIALMKSYDVEITQKKKANNTMFQW